jgi:hypothetical protein
MKVEWEAGFKEIYNGFFPDEKFLRILENAILEVAMPDQTGGSSFTE